MNLKNDLLLKKSKGEATRPKKRYLLKNTGRAPVGRVYTRQCILVFTLSSIQALGHFSRIGRMLGPETQGKQTEV